MKLEILHLLEEILLERRRLLPSNSYSSYLFECGLPKILDKLGEEVVELVVASRHRPKQEVVNEAADAIFHLLVFMVFMKIKLDDMLPDQEGFSDDQLEKVMSGKERGFFYKAAMDSVARLIILSSDDDGSHERYEKINNKCRQLFYCVLLLCNSRQLKIPRVLEELKDRLRDSPQEDRNFAVTH